MLPEYTEKIKEALHTFTDWATRSEIAKVLGKKRLNPYEIAALELLAAQGHIEAERRPTPGSLVDVWFYRVKETNEH